MKIVFGLILLVILIPVLGRCDDLSTRSYSDEAVTFVVSIPVEKFSQNAIILVTLLDEEQLEMHERNAGCVSQFNLKTRTQKVICPEGVKYQKVSPPEKFKFPVQEITASIEFTSIRIRLGKKYSLHISGLSNDNCNTTSANVKDIANSRSITIEKLPWSSTEIFCQGNEDVNPKVKEQFG